MIGEIGKIEYQNDNEEIKEILTKYITQSRKTRYRMIKFISYYKRSLAISFFILIVSIVLILFILLSGFTFSKITEFFSIAALILSLTNIMYRFIQLMEYPVKDLVINNLKDDLYELNFLIKNAGHGKLKLDFAFYTIENRDFSKSDDFFSCSSMEMGEYFGNLLKKFDSSGNDEMELFSLKIMQSDHDVFFTHESFNTETRLAILKQNRLYKITFFFQTSKKVNYEICKHIST